MIGRQLIALAGFLGSMASRFGFGAKNITPAPQPPNTVHYLPGSRHRSRGTGPARPAGSKLSRQAEKARIGKAELK